MSLSQDDELVLTAYVDGELGPIEAARFEQRLAEEPELIATLEAWRALRTALRSGRRGPAAGKLHPRIASVESAPSLAVARGRASPRPSRWSGCWQGG